MTTNATFLFGMLVLGGAMVLSCSSVSQNNSVEENVFTLAAQIPLPGVSGRIDHIAYDDTHHIAFIAALGNNTVEVVNIKTKQVLHSITRLKAPQGIAYLPAWNRLVVADDGGSVSFFDVSSFEKLSAIDVGDDADNVRYDDDAGLIYVGYGNGSIAVIDAGTLKQVAAIRLQGHPESFQLDKKQNRLYVNVPEADKIQVADLTSRSVIADWKNEEVSSNFPMALDEENQALFIVYRNPPVLKMLDVRNGKTIATADCSGDADDVFYDALDSMIFITAGKGFIDVFKVASTGQLIRINQIETRSGARTSLWLGKEKKLLLAVPSYHGDPAALWVYDFREEKQ